MKAQVKSIEISG